MLTWNGDVGGGGEGVFHWLMCTQLKDFVLSFKWKFVPLV